MMRSIYMLALLLVVGIDVYCALTSKSPAGSALYITLAFAWAVMFVAEYTSRKTAVRS